MIFEGRPTTPTGPPETLQGLPNAFRGASKGIQEHPTALQGRSRTHPPPPVPSKSFQFEDIPHTSIFLPRPCTGFQRRSRATQWLPNAFPRPSRILRGLPCRLSGSLGYRSSGNRDQRRARDRSRWPYCGLPVGVAPRGVRNRSRPVHRASGPRHSKDLPKPPQGPARFAPISGHHRPKDEFGRSLPEFAHFPQNRPTLGGVERARLSMCAMFWPSSTNFGAISTDVARFRPGVRKYPK